MFEIIDRVREIAYFCWLQEGKPQGRAQDHWDFALNVATGEIAYSIWQLAGSPMNDEQSARDARWCGARGIVFEAIRTAQVLAA